MAIAGEGNDWFARLCDARLKKKIVDHSIFNDCESFAKVGDVKAQAELSLMLYCGDGADMNLPEAFKWLEAAAEQDAIQVNMTFKRGREYNLPGAYFGLFVMWWMGVGVPQSDEMSNKNLKLAAKAGYAAAMHEIGSRHHIGLYGFEYSDIEAKKWFLKAVEHGSKSSYGNLSDIYSGNQNFERAFHYLTLAAHNDGYSVHYSDLAKMHHNGRGTTQNDMKALIWYYVAAVQTDYYNEDIVELVNSMEKAEVEQGIVEAERWLIENEKNLPNFVREFDRPTFL